MTAEEKARFNQMEVDIQSIKDDVSGVKKDMSEIKDAIIGNQLSGSGGIVMEISVMKERIFRLETENKALSEEKVKNGVYVKIIAWLLGLIGAGLIGFIIDSILTRH